MPDSFAREAAGPWAQTAVNLFPLPNQGYLAPGVGQWTGGSDQPASLQAGSLRIDRAFGSRVNLFGRYGDSPSVNNFGDVAIGRLDMRSQTLTLGLTARPFSHLTLDARINESQTGAQSSWGVPAAGEQAGCALQQLASAIGWPGPCETVVRFTIDGIGQLISGDEGLHRLRQFQTVDTASVRTGRHSLGFGIDYRRVTAIRRDAGSATEAIANNANDLSNTSDLWKTNSLAVHQSAELTEYSTWAQDTWQVHPRLTITYGLRWEFSPPPDPGGEIETTFTTPWAARWKLPMRLYGPRLYRHNLAPRIGAALRLTKDGRTVLRAGAGLYYDSSLSIATDILDGGPLNFAVDIKNGSRAPFSFALRYGFEPDLKLPQIRQWNVSLERAITGHDFVSLGYSGSNGRELIRREVDGPGSSPNLWFALTTNNGFSNYQALQFQYRRQIANGLQASASYAWSHSIDNDSKRRVAVVGQPGGASPNFDFSAIPILICANRSTPPSAMSSPRANSRVGGPNPFCARSGFPISVLESEQYTGIAFTNFTRPNYLGGPVWVPDASAPGGMRLNESVFQTVKSGAQGDLGRNSIGGLGMWQIDAAIGREFRWRDRFRLDARVEAFNALNRANLADPVRYLDSPLFGQSTSMLNLMLGTGSPGSGLAPMLQSGGPRLLQGTVRFWF